jgi:hypothetical protein
MGPYTTADTAIAFLNSLMAFTEWSLCFQCHGNVAAMARPNAYLRVLDFGGGLETLEGMRDICCL